MTAKEYHEQITSKCKKCGKHLMCKEHQAMWFKVVEQSPRKFEPDESSRKFLSALNKTFFR